MKKLTRKVIWMFAIGQLGWSTLSAIVTNWVISFYQPDTEMLEAGQKIFLPQGRVILGLVTILGGIYALGRLFDAVTDPWIANLSDRSSNPRGRRLPFMRRAAIPLTLATVLVYWSPVDGESPVNGVWVLVMMLLFYLFMTVYCTPYNALIAELSGTQEELTAISTAISFTFIFGSALGYACPFIWGALTPSLGRVMAIRVTFIVLAAFALICLLVPTFTINERDYVDIHPVQGNAFSSLTKNDLVATVFAQKFGAIGSGFIAVSIMLFAFSTVLGWSHYGTKACEYLLGEKYTIIYRVLFVLAVFGGATMGDNLAWDLADTFNGLMMIPNLIGVIVLSGTVAKITKNYIDRHIRNLNVEPMYSAFPDAPGKAPGDFFCRRKGRQRVDKTRLKGVKSARGRILFS